MKVTLHSQTHEWRERTAEGRVRFVRAAWDTRQWSFSETFKDTTEWVALAAPALEDYEMLRDVLWRKYQRRRVPWRFVEQLDELLEGMRGGAQ